MISHLDGRRDTTIGRFLNDIGVRQHLEHIRPFAGKSCFIPENSASPRLDINANGNPSLSKRPCFPVHSLRMQVAVVLWFTTCPMWTVAGFVQNEHFSIIVSPSNRFANIYFLLKQWPSPRYQRKWWRACILYPHNLRLQIPHRHLFRWVNFPSGKNSHYHPNANV
jgi:hypothetical protein